MSKSDIERRLQDIEKRNERVEKDKEWETSIARRLIITLGTYFTVLIYLLITNTDKAVLAAVVPALGYLLSTLVVRSAKDKWLNKS